jgi:hypothetical protein
MHPQQARGFRDRERRVDRTGGQGGRHAGSGSSRLVAIAGDVLVTVPRWKKCQDVGGSLPSSLFLPIVRRSYEPESGVNPRRRVRRRASDRGCSGLAPNNARRQSNVRFSRGRQLPGVCPWRVVRRTRGGRADPRPTWPATGEVPPARPSPGRDPPRCHHGARPGTSSPRTTTLAARRERRDVRRGGRPRFHRRSRTMACDFAPGRCQRARTWCGRAT